MARLNYEISLALIFLFFVTGLEAVAPLFLQAITSALATIPLTGGPMTTGLVGAKLGIGTKLLYYLGFFGRRSRPVAKKAAPVSPGGKVPGGLQPVPLPYLSGGGGFQQMGGGGFGGGNPFGGGSQQMGGGFGGNFQESPFGGIDPSQVFAALRAQGYDPNTAMQLMNYGNGGGFGMGGGGGGFGMGGGGGGFMPGEGGLADNAGNFPSNVPQPGQFNAVPGQGMGGGGQFPPSFNPVPGQGMGGGGQFPPSFNPVPGQGMGGMGEFPPFNPVTGQGIPNQGNGGFGEHQNEHLPNQPSETDEPVQEPDDVESFFTFLRDMDENTCISRLICDIGADPSFLGDFSENIHGIVGSLDVQPSSGAFPYIEIMETGKKEGGCDIRFPECTDTAYDIVKNVAPSVGVPQNINSAAINQL